MSEYSFSKHAAALLGPLRDARGAGSSLTVAIPSVPVTPSTSKDSGVGRDVALANNGHVQGIVNVGYTHGQAMVRADDPVRWRQDGVKSWDDMYEKGRV